MRRPALLLVLVCAALLVTSTSTIAQPKYEFKLGFELLASFIPDVAGEPLEDEHHNPQNGDALQQTTTGLMVWRKFDNWTAFTNGQTTWINGPFGVQSRPNNMRFEWEQEPPALIAVPTPTSVPPAPTPVPPSPTPNPKPAPGTVLYQADWSSGVNGWLGTKDWKWVNGMLVNDGTLRGNSRQWGFIEAPSMEAPFKPSFPDYAVEIEAQLLGLPSDVVDTSFGISFRGGQRAVVVPDYIELMDMGYKQYQVDNKWHTYRLEARGNQFRLLFDGALIAEGMNNRFLSPGSIGLWSCNVQLNMRSFKVIAL